MKKIAGDQVFYKQKWMKDGCLIIDNGKISDVIPNDDSFQPDRHEEGMIVPGFFDTHIHGYKGTEVISGTIEELKKMSMDLLECGVTAFCPTFQTDSEQNIEEGLRRVAKASREFKGAKMAGIFLEGPFLSEKYKGAQDGRFLQKPSIELLQRWQSIAEGKIKKIAIAPELEGALELIEYAVKENIVVSIGHTNATAEQTNAAISKGASILIHTFNAMRGLHHREPGVLGAGLVDDHVYAEMICDGYHIDPLIAELILKIKGPEKTILITDGTNAGGMPDGTYMRASTPVFVKDGAVRTEEGKLAGSSLTLIEAIRNMVNWGKSDLYDAIEMASLTPAKSLRMDGTYGSIDKGRAADFVVLNKKMEIEAVYIDGKRRYEKEDR